MTSVQPSNTSMINTKQFTISPKDGRATLAEMKRNVHNYVQSNSMPTKLLAAVLRLYKVNVHNCDRQL
jgi:hypothetical protein